MCTKFFFGEMFRLSDGREVTLHTEAALLGHCLAGLLRS